MVIHPESCNSAFREFLILLFIPTSIVIEYGKLVFGEKVVVRVGAHPVPHILDGGIEIFGDCRIDLGVLGVACNI